MPKTKLPDRGKPTPGPWEESRTIIGTGEFTGRIGVQIMNRDGWEVARVFDPEYDGISPNVKKMIASPELLAALEYLLEQTVDMDLKHGIELTEGEREARTMALNAIAKAKGEK